MSPDGIIVLSAIAFCMGILGLLYIVGSYIQYKDKQVTIKRFENMRRYLKR